MADPDVIQGLRTTVGQKYSVGLQVAVKKSSTEVNSVGVISGKEPDV